MKSLTETAAEEIRAEDSNTVIARIKTLLRAKEDLQTEIARIEVEIGDLETLEGAKKFLVEGRRRGNNYAY